MSNPPRADATSMRASWVKTQSEVITRLNLERVAHGVTYRALGVICGMPVASVCGILRGKSKEPSWIALMTIITALDSELRSSKEKPEKKRR